MYKERKLLWDPTVEDYKNRNKKHDTWRELDEEFGVAVGETEKKIRKLIGQFNRECRKVTKTGKAAGEEGKWMYFKHLLFLKDKNRPRSTLEGGIHNADDNEFEDHEVDNSQILEHEVEGDSGGDANIYPTWRDNSSSSTATCMVSAKSSKPSSTRTKLNKNKSNAMAEEAYGIMKHLITKKRDEYDVFGENVAVSLRKLSKVAASYAKFEMNKILFNAEMGHYDFGHSTALVSSGESHSQHIQQTENRTEMHSPQESNTSQLNIESTEELTKTFLNLG